MAMAKTYVSGAPGTGNITIGAAVPKFQTFAAAGAVDGDTFPYSVTDINDAAEIGEAEVTASGTQIIRTVVYSTNSNNPLLSLIHI